MAYFSNGTEGMVYEERYCNRCVHQGGPNGPGCHVWVCHLLYAYEECNNKSNAKAMLDTLIPMDEETGFAGQCTMFHEMTEAEKAEQAEAYAVANSEPVSALHEPNVGPVVMPSMLEWAQRRGLA